MDQTSPISDVPALARVPHDPATRRRPQLALVDARLKLVHPEEHIPEDWRSSLESLLGWLGISAEIAPAARAGRFRRLAGWPLPDTGAAPLFAPWLGWSAAAFQHGGSPRLPQALFVASYLVDHPRSAAPGQPGVDLVLMSPHPAQCLAEEAGGVPLVRARAMTAMIRTARAQQRERLAIIVTARQRNAVATRLIAGGRGVSGDRMTIEILTIEDALPLLMRSRPQWDAIIAMPELRSTVFTLLAHTSGVCGAWPMVWHGGEGARALRLVSSEAPGDGMSRLPLDAAALVHALTLFLHSSGAAGQAARLNQAWAMLRDSGVTTAACGAGDAPYSKEVTDRTFVEMICAGGMVSKRPQPDWMALHHDKAADVGSQKRFLRVITSNHDPVPG